MECVTLQQVYDLAFGFAMYHRDLHKTQEYISSNTKLPKEKVFRVVALAYIQVRNNFKK